MRRRFTKTLDVSHSPSASPNFQNFSFNRSFNQTVSIPSALLCSVGRAASADDRARWRHQNKLSRQQQLSPPGVAEWVWPLRCGLPLEVRSNITFNFVKWALRSITSQLSGVAGNDCGTKSAARRWDCVPPPFCAAEFDLLACEPAHQTNQRKDTPLLRHTCLVC